MPVYFPVWHLHCTRARLTVLVSWNGEIAFHSRPLLCLQRQVTKLASGLFDCWPLLGNNNMATNPQGLASSYSRERESLLAQTLNNFVQIKAKALGHRKKLLNRLSRRAPLDSFMNSYRGLKLMAELYSSRRFAACDCWTQIIHHGR